MGAGELEAGHFSTICSLSWTIKMLQIVALRVVHTEQLAHHITQFSKLFLSSVESSNGAGNELETPCSEQATWGWWTHSGRGAWRGYRWA